MAEAARVLDTADEYFYGTAIPKGIVFEEPAVRPVEVPAAEERVRQRERARAATMAQELPSVSLFAVFGALFVGILMIFVLLAQINYNEIISEMTRLEAQRSELMELQRTLEITFESVIDMKEVERYARDELGMSKPDADQVAVIRVVPSDKAEIINGSEEDWMYGLGSFISSLLEYFRRS